jgi:hypothetical protein
MQREPDRTYNDDELMNGMVNGNSDVFRYILDNTLPYVQKLLGKGDTRHQAEEIIRDAYIVIFRKLITGGIPLKCKFLTYFIAVCKNILKYSRELNRNVAMIPDNFKPEVSLDEQEIEMLWRESREFRLYRHYFIKLNEKQQKILACSLDGMPYLELYPQFGYKSVEAFKNEVSRIKKKLFRMINEDPEYQFLINRTFWSYEV